MMSVFAITDPASLVVGDIIVMVLATIILHLYYVESRKVHLAE